MDRRQVLVGGLAGAGVAVIGRATASDVQAPDVGKRAQKRAADKAQAFLDAFEAPGLSLAYVREGRIRYAGAFGVADRQAGTALRTDHRFRVASVSKPITSVAIWKLVENGELAVDQKAFGAQGVLSDYSLDAAPERDWVEDITIDHLLTHSAGGWTNDGNDPMFQDPALTQPELIQKTLDTAALINRPGTAYAYSNFGYCLLGRVIEAVTGQPYEQAVRELVLDPADAAGMVVSRNTPEERYVDEVIYYDDSFDPYRPNVARMDAHGGWVATASELVRFVLHVDGYKAVPDILGRETVGRMVAPGPASPGYARGWSINPNHNNRWHNGGMPGTASLMVRVEGGGHFAGLVNTRVIDPDINGALDALMWSIYDEVNS